MSQILISPRLNLETGPLPGPSAVISIRDPLMPEVQIKDAANVIARLDLCFHDINEDMPPLIAPTMDDARKILAFLQCAGEANIPNLVLQCERGVGRSVAIGAFVSQERERLLDQGTHNRLLYRMLLELSGQPAPAEPLISMIVRVKYPPEYLLAFILSMRRQRHQNWELIAVTDGPNTGASCAVASWFVAAQCRNVPNIRIIETPEARGRWGHPWRQLGIEQARGEWIGLSNDDNYYCPGYLEQMVRAGEKENAGLVLSEMVHSYGGWLPFKAELETADVGNWIARRSLIDRVPWNGEQLQSDREYVQQLAASERVAFVRRPLFVKN